MKNLYLSTAAILLLAFTTVPVSGQRTQSMSERSYRSARRILDTGLQALGGIETFRKVDDISLKCTARWYETGQSANPAAPYDVRQEEVTRVFDLRGGRSYRDQKTQFRGVSPYWGRQILKDKESFILDVNSNVAYPVNSSAVAGCDYGGHPRGPRQTLLRARRALRFEVPFGTEPVLAEALDGTVRPALCFIAPHMNDAAATSDYVGQLAEAVRAAGLPEWYREFVASFGPEKSGKE